MALPITSCGGCATKFKTRGNAHLLLSHISIAHLLAFTPIIIAEIGSDAIVAAESIITLCYLYCARCCDFSQPGLQ